MARTPRVLPGGQTDERTHVLEVLGNAIVGGMENYVRNLAANLPSNEYKVSLLCPYESPYTALLRSEGRDVYIAPLRDDPPWKTVEFICTLVRETRVDLLHAHLMNAHTVAAVAGRLSGTPTVATLHGMSLHPQEISVARTTESHTIVVCREAWSQALAVGLAPELVSLVPNGVDLAMYHPMSADPLDFRQTISIGPDDLLVGFVGRLAWEKGPDKFLKAAEFILQRRPEVHFAMVGTGSMEKDLTATVHRAGLGSRIHMVGLAREPHRIYPALDLLLHTSRADAMPLTILEAMASGVPVVAIGVGGVPEIVATGETGILIGTTEWPGIVSEYPGDWEGVALAAISLLSNPAKLKSMAGASVRRAQASFDIRQSATLTSHVFRQLLGSRPDRARLHSVP
ncbi:glycosyltransferase family 4 protein [Mesorhizobium sp. NZP2298]|uniref:glycosyltransferase family 4 protein n=1 Tax=Mesorhizobium sp. NZP2298 TaxID=2483403 RepID=UPI00155447D8|nr:glycosyltransferase family 4 protein [Mesorhizobium sp. NZP2298]QKC98313.1 glycosyltransferase family 1 protein [Mesorhizobium sp. NZP2298]